MATFSVKLNDEEYNGDRKNIFRFIMYSHDGSYGYCHELSKKSLNEKFT